MSLIEIINSIISCAKLTTYLELGVEHGRVLAEVEAQYKFSVFPQALPHVTHAMTTDDFFSICPQAQRFDLVLIGTRRPAALVEKDVFNAVNKLSPTGLILLGDCTFSTELRGPEVLEEHRDNGERLMATLRHTRPDLTLAIIDDGGKWGVIRRGRQAQRVESPSGESPTKLPSDDAARAAQADDSITPCSPEDFLERLNRELELRIDQRGFWVGSGAFTEHAFDESLAAELKAFFCIEAQSVLDVGCGMGDYVRTIRDGGVACEGVDGNPQTPELTSGLCSVLDVSRPVDLARIFDWVLCLEVAEHIPVQFESVLVENLVRHSGKGIVVSWAVPGQGGYGHFNERPNSYVEQLFSQHGFYSDTRAQTRLRTASSLPWFKNTLLVFRREQAGS